MDSTDDLRRQQNGSPLPDTLQLGFGAESAAAHFEENSEDTPLNNQDASLFNSGDDNHSNGKMLATEKLIGSPTTDSKLKRSSSVPMAKGIARDPRKQQRDELIMDTNKSSIVSKRSVEKLYYDGEPEYFRYFVSKFKRRSPLINRGYWLRMKAIEHGVSRFLAEQTSKRKVVVNLGCG